MRPSKWRELMPGVRAAAEGLARAGEVEICQRGEVRWMCFCNLVDEAVVLMLPASAGAGKQPVQSTCARKRPRCRLRVSQNHARAQ